MNQPKLCECGCGQAAPLASTTSRNQGRVRGQPLRFVHGHHLRAYDAHLIWDSALWEVRDCGYATPCWIWLGTRTARDYGGFGKKRAHRVSYERTKGPIPQGLELDHLCRMTLCVNPEHLEAVTHAENTRRGSRAKLTSEAAALIRELDTQGRTSESLARDFGVARRTIRTVISGGSWRSD